jgi:hypothetical protein
VPQDQKSGSGTVHRHDKARERRQARKRKKRPCRSAPSVPGSVTCTFGRRKTGKKDHWRARVRWNAVTTDVAGRSLNPEQYRIQLRATDSGGTPIELDGADEALWTRNIAADEPTHAVFSPLARPRAWYYQARVRCMNRVYGARCWSAWSAWTTPARAISGGPSSTGLAVTKKRPAPRRIEWTWTEPSADPEDVDQYRIDIYGGSPQTLKETVYKRSRHHRYAVPEADKGTAHKALIFPVDEEGTAGASVDSGDETEGLTVHGDTITPGTLPPSPTDLLVGDGSAPGSSPTPTLTGSLGVLVARWTPLANSDFTTYEVHLSTTTGFTPGAGTLSGETPGASWVFRTLPGGGTLVQGTTYYCKIIASDPDGNAAASAQASALLDKVSAADIVANTITANEIATGGVTASEINVSTLSAITAAMGTLTSGTIQSSIFQTATSGNRIKIDGSVELDEIQFISSTGGRCDIRAVADGIELGVGAPGKLGFFGVSPIALPPVINNLTIAGSPATNDALEDTSGFGAAVHRNFGDLVVKVNELRLRLNVLGLN